MSFDLEQEEHLKPVYQLFCTLCGNKVTTNCIETIHSFSLGICLWCGADNKIFASDVKMSYNRIFWFTMRNRPYNKIK